MRNSSLARTGERELGLEIRYPVSLGLQVSLRNRPFKVWFFKVQRLGLGYQFSPDGELTAITFSMSSWFTK